MKKCVIVLLFCLCFFPVICNKTYAENNIYVKVLYSEINVYLDTNFTDDYNKDGENLDIVYTFLYGSIIKVVEENQIIGQDGYKYYKVEYESNGQKKMGYVLCSQVLNINYSSPAKELDYNAMVNKEAKLFTLKNEQYIENGISLKINQKIKIINGYNSTKKYTQIQYKAESGDILTAFVLTSDIKVGGISKGTIGAIIIVVSIISLSLIVFGVKGKKKRKLLKK